MLSVALLARLVLVHCAFRVRHGLAVRARALVCRTQLAVQVEVASALVAVVIVVDEARRALLFHAVTAMAHVDAAHAVARGLVGLHVVARSARVGDAHLGIMLGARRERVGLAVGAAADVLLALLAHCMERSIAAVAVVIVVRVARGTCVCLAIVTPTHVGQAHGVALRTMVTSLAARAQRLPMLGALCATLADAIRTYTLLCFAHSLGAWH